MTTKSPVEEDSPMRIWRRTEKRWKRLKRWGSLPSWQLSPQDRPLLRCIVCKGISLHGDLCVCGQKCITVTVPTLKRRRVSSPQLLNDLQKEQLHWMQKRIVALHKPALEVEDRKATAPAESGTVRRRRHRDAAVFSIEDITAAARLNPEAKFYVQSIVAQDPASNTPASPISPGCADMIPMDKERDAANSTCPSPPRTLRRKKRFSLNRPRSNSLRDVSQCSEKPAPTTPPRSPLRERFGSVTSSPSKLGRACIDVPLGHPTRPLYSAIRKNMLSAATPPSSGSVSPAHSTFSHDVQNRAKSLDLHTSTIIPVPGTPYASHYVFSPCAVDLSSGIGFSVSGETELRMALARRNTIGGSASHPEYKFEYRETKRASGVKLTVKRFGRGLRNLVMFRRAMSRQPSSGQ